MKLLDALYARRHRPHGEGQRILKELKRIFRGHPEIKKRLERPRV